MSTVPNLVFTPPNPGSTISNELKVIVVSAYAATTTMSRVAQIDFVFFIIVLANVYFFDEGIVP